MSTTHPTYPHLTRAWADAVALELRLRGASGARVGDSLAEADAHCADSGETPEEAFGAPEDYVAALPVSEAERRSATTGATLRDALPSLAGLVGMLLAFQAMAAWQSGAGVPVRHGMLLGALIIIATSVLVVWRGDVFLRRVWAGGLLLGAALVATVAAFLLLTGTLVVLPVPVTVVLVLALLAVPVIVSLRDDTDEVVDPLRGRSDSPSDRWLRRLHPWLFPILTLIGLGLLAAINAAA